MKITIDLLKQHNACERGLRLFAKYFPNGVEWNREGWLAVLRTTCREYLCWTQRNIVGLSRVDLSGANLQGADLSGADLSGADLREVDLFRVDLRWAKGSER